MWKTDFNGRPYPFKCFKGWLQQISLFFLSFLSRTLTKHGTADEGGRHFFNTSLPLPPASLALRHWPGDCCGGLISAHSYQPSSNQEPLVSKRKSLTTKLRALTWSILEYFGLAAILQWESFFKIINYLFIATSLFSRSLKRYQNMYSFTSEIKQVW